MLRNHSLSITVTAPTLVGTLRWMAPELFQDDSRPSKVSDIYAFGMVAYEVGPHLVLWRIKPDEHSCRFLHTKCHSLVFSLFSYRGESSMENGPRGHQTERSLASRTRSGFSRGIVGTGIPSSGHISRTSFPPSRQLPAVGYHRPRRKFRISVSIIQPPSKVLRRGDQPTWSWLISLIIQPNPSLPLIPNTFTSKRGPG